VRTVGLWLDPYFIFLATDKIISSEGEELERWISAVLKRTSSQKFDIKSSIVTTYILGLQNA
jgi:hypothetical protein